MTDPMRPDEVGARKAAQLPTEVITAFDELIARNWNGSSAVVFQNDVVQRLENAGFDRRRIFDEHLLDIEEAYRLQGWTVVYDKPGFNESGKDIRVFEVALALMQ